MDAIRAHIMRCSAAIEAKKKAARHGPRPTAKPSDNTLEPLENCCRKVAGEEGAAFVTDSYELRQCRCKNWFCPECAKRMGLALRRRAVEAIKRFAGVLIFPCTVDRTLFRNAQEAYEWVREHHGIGRLVQNLKRRGSVMSGRYFWVLDSKKLGGRIGMFW